MDTRYLTEDNCYITSKKPTQKELDLIADTLVDYAIDMPFFKLVSKHKTRQSLEEFSDTEENLYTIRSMIDDHIIGAFCIAVFDDWWTDELLLGEVFVCCVDKSFTGVGRVAVKEIKRKSHEMGIRFIQSGSFLSSDNQSIKNLYINKMGFDAYYLCFYKMMNGGRRTQ